MHMYTHICIDYKLYVYDCVMINNDILFSGSKKFVFFFRQLKSRFNLANDKPRVRHLIPSSLV